MNHQQTFNALVIFAHKQNAKATSRPGGGACLYRTPEGRCCFVGAFIPDNEYSSEMDSTSTDVTPDNTIKGIWGVFPSLHKSLHIDGLSESATLHFWETMQEIHDDTAVEDWQDEFIRYAHEQGLNYVAPR